MARLKVRVSCLQLAFYEILIGGKRALGKKLKLKRRNGYTSASGDSGRWFRRPQRRAKAQARPGRRNIDRSLQLPLISAAALSGCHGIALACEYHRTVAPSAEAQQKHHGASRRSCRYRSRQP